MIIGQAALESGWGKSRFATEGNNLFGIRTWKEEVAHLLPMGVEKWPGWGVKSFASKCDSVKYYIDLLNNHSAYEKFRKLRLTTNDSMRLIKTLDKFSTTTDYDQRVIRMINKIRKLEENNGSHTMEDMTEMKRIINAEKACKDATSDWGKKYWYRHI